MAAKPLKKVAFAVSERVDVPPALQVKISKKKARENISQMLRDARCNISTCTDRREP